MQRELGLTDTEIGLVTSVYLLPGVLLAVPTGMLADRFGRRRVLSVGLLVFGICGIAGLLAYDRFPLLLAIRFAQGAAFAAVLSVTITVLGDRFEGPLQVTAQGLRSLALKLGDAAMPLIGGLLAGIAWYTPMVTQLAALPLAAAVWLRLADESEAPPRRSRRIGRAADLARQVPVAVLLAAGFFRFFFKFAYLTYVPVLAVGSGALSVLQVGALLGVAALAAAVSAPLAGQATTFMRPSTAVGVSVVSIGLAFLLVSVQPGAAVLWVSALVFGIADGLFGVVQTALTTQIPDSDVRATFVGFAATLRNLGKFAAPTVVGGLVVWLTVARSFGVVGSVAIASVTMVLPLRRLEGDIGGTRD